MYQWQGRLLSQELHEIHIEARFSAENGMMVDIPIAKGDRFLETYYDDRWFNVFEIRDKQDDSLKGWYCNIAAPAIIRPGEITFRDFALDLLVYPDGRQLVLDEDEFGDLNLPAHERIAALRAIETIRHTVAQREGPFHTIV